MYTGGDTKIERSNAEGEKPKDKKSFIMRSVDRLLIVMLLAQTAMCATAGLVYGLWVWKHADDVCCYIFIYIDIPIRLYDYSSLPLILCVSISMLE